MDHPIATCTKETVKQNTKKDFDNYNSEFVRGNNFHDSDDDYGDSSDSLETVSDEIPIWIHGEQRWISGVNEDTTCADIVNVLLADEGFPTETLLNRSFVITERWRRVEQILHDDTKILQIWSAWGHTKSEVKLTLRQIETSLNLWQNSSHDKDSGMGSPNGSSNSAIIRRRRHRASKSTTAWVTQAQTIHPKSQKATIEKLMKLILEQGETIQQQLAKLRDRELQIAKIEEERHKIREKEHGKNYLLETYLNGLHEAEEKEVVTVNSDSGVQTEGALSSPEISSYNHEDEDYRDTTDDIQRYEVAPTLRRGLKTITTIASTPNTGEITTTIMVPKSTTTTTTTTTTSYSREKTSHRERKLLKEHKHTKEFSSLLLNEINTNNNKNNSSPTTEQFKEEFEDDMSAKIEWMEKLVLINKHLQREEELLVRLGAKIRKYESENPLLNENQIREALLKVNASIEVRNNEIKKTEDDLILSNEQLQEKTDLLEMLSRELFEIERNDGGNKLNEIVQTKNLDFNNREILAENLYSYSQYISKPNYEFNENNENRDYKIYTRHTPDHMLNSTPFSLHPCDDNSVDRLQQLSPSSGQIVPSIGGGGGGGGVGLPQNLQINSQSIYKIQPEFLNQKILQAPILDCRNKNPICGNGGNTGTGSRCSSSSGSSSSRPLDLATSINLLQKSNQTHCAMNVYAATSTSGNPKLGQKKMISGICNEFESNSDTGLSSMGEDVTQLGTLV